MASRSSKMIVDLLEERGLSQAALSDSTGVSYSYTNHVVKGRQLPSAEWLELAAGALSLGESERRRLLAAAARDVLEQRGFDPMFVDLTVPD